MSRRLRRALRQALRRRAHYRQSRPHLDSPMPTYPSEAQPDQELPVCGCGKIVKYAGIHICEDCFVNMQVRWPGKATRVRIHF
jgi:hypothetical protein